MMHGVIAAADASRKEWLSFGFSCRLLLHKGLEASASSSCMLAKFRMLPVKQRATPETPSIHDVHKPLQLDLWIPKAGPQGETVKFPETFVRLLLEYQ